MSPRDIDGAIVGSFVQGLAELGSKRFFLLRCGPMTSGQRNQRPQHCRYRDRASLTEQSKPHWLSLLQQSKNRKSKIRKMPSFDIVSEVDAQELDNAVNQEIGRASCRER